MKLHFELLHEDRIEIATNDVRLELADLARIRLEVNFHIRISEAIGIHCLEVFALIDRENNHRGPAKNLKEN